MKAIDKVRDVGRRKSEMAMRTRVSTSDGSLRRLSMLCSDLCWLCACLSLVLKTIELSLEIIAVLRKDRSTYM